VCLLNLAFVGALAAFFTMSDKDVGILSPRFDPVLRIIQIVGWLGVVGTLAVLYSTLRSWREPERWWLSKVADTVVAVASLAFVWFVYIWNMLHWSLRY
jgi:hypothetical protein